jgi:gluconokinase
MMNGTPLDDADRLPWLEAIRNKMDEVRLQGGNGVFTCSALKASYREILLRDTPNDVMLVYLHGDPKLIMERVERRQGHYMRAGMVKSQLRILEVPSDAVIIDIRADSKTQVTEIIGAIRTKVTNVP